jgi:3-deoxy-manno-octulosonate cytidylyltransferase (CMP-KDO synthetase)
MTPRSSAEPAAPPPFHVLIPARLGAARLPGKPLLPVAGRPLIEWVWRRARASGARTVLIATDDERIHAAAHGFGADCVLTSSAHASGTDRIAEVARARGFAPEEIVVNLQGDEPLMPPALLARVATLLAGDATCDLATAAAPIASLEEFLDPSCVKVVASLRGEALYFSRAPIPFPRETAVQGRPMQCAGAWRHIGLYAYRVHSLLRFAALAPTQLEQTEKLEQLRALEHGMRIRLLHLDETPPAGVDTPEDLERVRAQLNSTPGSSDSDTR